MTNKAKLALVATLAVMRLAATPALGQSYSAGYGSGNELPFNSQSLAHRNAPRHAAIHAARRNGLHAYAMTPQHARRTALDAARAAAIHDCNIEADKYNPITQLPNQFAEYGTCMAEHGQWFD